jgi:nucleoid-associated protein YgaU
MAYRGALATLVIATLVTIFLVIRPPESRTKADAPRLVPTSTVALGPTATATPPRTPSGPTTTVRTAVPSPSVDAPTSPTAAGETTYVVRGGDTLGAIAEQFGIRLDALIAANPGVDATPLQVGATLKIPKAP